MARVNHLLLQYVRRLRERKRLKRAARRLRAQLLGAPSMEERVRIICSNTDFRPIQLQRELSDFATWLSSRSLRAVLEIGSARGGVLALLSSLAADDAIVVGIDINLEHTRLAAFREFAREDQKVYGIPGDSHVLSTYLTVKSILRGRQLDLIFIDGDHTFMGVTQDWAIYSTLLSHAGIVAFHDIIYDSRLRRGSPTRRWVGEVPYFWEALKKAYPGRFCEFVECYEQDGYGIGVVAPFGTVPTLV